MGKNFENMMEKMTIRKRNNLNFTTNPPVRWLFSLSLAGLSISISGFIGAFLGSEGSALICATGICFVLTLFLITFILLSRRRKKNSWILLLFTYLGIWLFSSLFRLLLWQHIGTLLEIPMAVVFLILHHEFTPQNLWMHSMLPHGPGGASSSQGYDPGPALSLPPSPNGEIATLMDELIQANEQLQRLLESRIQSPEEFAAWQRETERLGTVSSRISQELKQFMEMDQARAQEENRQIDEFHARLGPWWQQQAETAARQREAVKNLTRQLEAQEAYIRELRGGAKP